MWQSRNVFTKSLAPADAFFYLLSAPRRSTSHHLLQHSFNKVVRLRCWSAWLQNSINTKDLEIRVTFQWQNNMIEIGRQTKAFPVNWVLWAECFKFLRVFTFRGNIVVSISACHAEDPGSIPGGGMLSFFMNTDDRDELNAVVRYWEQQMIDARVA